MPDQPQKIVGSQQYSTGRVDQKSFTKQNSFSEIRHRSPVRDILPRVQKVLENLPSLDLSDYQKTIVKSACNELLKKSTPEGDFKPFTLYSYNIAEMDRLGESNLPRYLFYRYRYDVFPQRQKLDYFPPCLQIEPTSICNYRCLFCFQIDKEFTDKRNGMMGSMALDLFKSLIDQAEGNCEAVTLSSRGEPMICPDFEKMLVYASGKFLALKVNTNASLMDEKKCHAILDAGVNTVVFSAEATSDPSYSKLRVGGQLDNVFKNIVRFRHILEKHYPHSQTITRISGVKIPGADDLNTMEAFWGDFVDEVAFVNYNPWENSYQQTLNGIMDPCSDLWRRMFVWWDGTVNPCDSDFKSTLTVGNTREMPLSELWASGKYTRLREQHMIKQRRNCSPCNRCAVI